MNRPYYIIEVANTHGGDINYLFELIESFSNLNRGYGVKFQAFHPDYISTADYSFYETYKDLHFDKQQWKEIINKAEKTKDVWLDIFDSFGIDVLQDNSNSVYGIKFQSSVLYNHEVFNALEAVDLSRKKIILNVAAHKISDIKRIIDRVAGTLRAGEMLLEFGYQAYPTSLKDSGVCKLEPIRKHFSNRIVFADHVDGKSEDAIWLPVVASMMGVDVIEKHVMLDKRTTEYDHFSSLTPSRFTNMVEEVERYVNLKEMPFINQKEEEYLQKSIMVPILKHGKVAGSCVDLQEDVVYRRSGKAGLNAKEIGKIQEKFHLLAVDKSYGEILNKEDFRRATIATIIACRLKSTRLPRKAILKIGELASVERCIKSCLEFSNTNYTILATSDLPEDIELRSYTYRSDVVFHTGDPEDVVQRYLDIADKLKVDVVIRVTADCPFVSHEIVSLLLNVHFTNGADYTVARNAAIGTSAEIINTSALRKIKRHFKSADYSEYMTWYFQNNPKHFKLKFLDLPDDLIRDYRLTLDYPEDLEMLNRLQMYFDENNLEFDLKKAFAYLDSRSEVSQLNAHLTLRYKADHQLIETLNKVTKITD